MAQQEEKNKKLLNKLIGIREEISLSQPKCTMHFAKQPMKLSRGNKQYVYDESGYEFLDCCDNISHVGHCHPHVTFSGQKQMQTLSTARGFVTDIQTKYCKSLLETVSGGTFDTVLLVNSGSEANDLAIRLAQAYTQRRDVISLAPAVHGYVGSLLDIHYKVNNNKTHQREKSAHCHLAPVCNSYRGMYADSTDPSHAAAEKVKEIATRLREDKTPVACLITECVNTAAGLVVPPKGFLPKVCQLIHEEGGLVIMDEVLTGMGRLGTHMWGFQHFDIMPDIITCGRSMANGQPLAAVITSSAIASSIPLYENSYGGNPVSCAMGQAVLDVLYNEKLLVSSTAVGNALISGLKDLLEKHVNLGDIRGLGLFIALEVVADKESRKPAKEFAEKISYHLRDEYKILAPVDGPDKNVILLNPPMCFTMENAHTVIEGVDKAFTDISSGKMERIQDIFELRSSVIDHCEIFGSGAGNKRKLASEQAVKIAKYEDLD